MAAPKRNAMLIQKTKDAARATQLMNRLVDHGVGKIELSNTQVRAIEVVLKKIKPDLSATTLDAGEGMIEAMKGIQVRFVKPGNI